MTEAWWDLLKTKGGAGSYRMNPTSGHNTVHMPTEIDNDRVRQFLIDNPDSVLGDLMQPYLTGQLSPAAPEPEEGYDADARSFQQQAYRQRTPGVEERQQVDAPFPLSEEEAQQHIDYMQGETGWDIPTQDTGPIDPKYQAVSNAMRVLQGRMRQAPEIGFTPQRTASTGRGVKASSHAPRMTMYANTPLTVLPRTTEQTAGQVGVRGVEA